MAMGETRRKFDRDFREGAVRLVRETGKPIAQVARDLGINEGTLGNWVNADKRRRGEGNGTPARAGSPSQSPQDNPRSPPRYRPSAGSASTSTTSACADRRWTKCSSS